LPFRVLPSAAVPEIVGGEVFPGLADARTAGVAFDVSLLEPSAFVAFTRNRIVSPTRPYAAIVPTPRPTAPILNGRSRSESISAARPTPLLEMTLEEFRRVLRVNLEGTFLSFRAAARHLAERGEGGVLVSTASTAAIEGAARNSHYGASKGGLTAYVRALAVELARYRIRVNSILPGWIETEMTARAFGDERFRAAVLPRIPARRWGTWDDFGGIAVYLMSDASAYHTGEQIVIDGGYTKF